MDWAIAEQTVLGDRELLKEIVVAFLEEAILVRDGIRLALKSNDAGTAGRLAHTIKAGFRTFGAQDAHDVAFFCEQAAKQMRLDEVAKMLPELESAISDVCEELRGFLNTGRADA